MTGPGATAGPTVLESGMFTRLKELKPARSFDSDPNRVGIGRTPRARHGTNSHRTQVKR